jgi:hypothetical protein
MVFGTHILLSLLVTQSGGLLSAAIGETRSASTATVAEYRVGGELPAQDALAAQPAPATEKTPWRFDAFVYYWAAGVSGNMTVDGEDIDHESGGDGFSGDPALTGFLGHFEAHRGPWSFALAPMFVNLDFTGDQSGAIDADVSIHAEVHEAFVAREISGPWEWLAGARYYELDTRVDLSAGGVPISSPDSDHSWVDPILGARFHDDFGEHWSMHARADVGGFGVGSDFAWNASALVGYRFGSRWAAQLGYRILHVDFQDGSGNDRLAYDMTMQGPIIGVSFSF